jgi:hypothetical protein
VVAGPVEATATGNLLVQALALGMVGTLAEARELVGQLGQGGAPPRGWRFAIDRDHGLAATSARHLTLTIDQKTHWRVPAPVL